MAAPQPSWIARAAEQSPSVQSSLNRSAKRATDIVAAARRLILEKGSDFTTQELVRNAGVAMQTFYNHFSGKDQLLLAVIEDIIIEGCQGFEAEASRLSDPLARLRVYLASIVGEHGVAQAGEAAKFITAEHWRLARLYPAELARATQPFTDLVLKEIVAATEAGVLRPPHPEYDAWLVNQLLMAVFHFHAFNPTEEPREVVVERLWAFCLGALGGTVPESAAKRRRKRG